MDKPRRKDASQSDKQRQLYTAARCGQVASVVDLLRSGVDPNGYVSNDILGYTCLHAATSMGHFAVVQMLRNYGADLYCMTTQGKSALFLASEGNHVELCQWLVGHCKEHINKACAYGMTPLYVASLYCNSSVVQCLLENGADVNVKCQSTGYTPLMIAALKGHSTVISLFVKHPGTHVLGVSSGHNTLLHLAAMSGDLITVKTISEAMPTPTTMLVDQRRSDSLTPAEVAYKLGFEAVYNYLQDVQRKGVRSILADELINAVFKGDVNMTKDVLQRGAHPNTAGLDSMSVLHIATEFEHLECIQLLIHCGSSLLSRDHKGKTPFHTAVEVRNASIVKWFLATEQSRESLLAVDCIGRTPLYIAVQNGYLEIVKLILSTSLGKDSLDVACMRSRTPLVCALQLGHTECASHLIAAGADTTLEDRTGTAPIHVAIKEGLSSMVTLLLSNPKSKLFLNTAHLTKRMTPLLLAAQWGEVNCVRSIIKAGGDIGVKNFEGQNSLHIAAQNGFIDIIRSILSQPEGHKILNVAGGFKKKTPLTLAIESGNAECIDLLKNVGASLFPDDHQKVISEGTAPLPPSTFNYSMPTTLEKVILSDTPFFSKDAALTFLNPKDLLDMYEHDNPCTILGKGAFGVVYKGKKTFRSIDVAVKVQYHSSASKDHFQKEKAVSFVKNPFLVPIIAACDHEQSLTLIYPLMASGDLQKRIDANTRPLTSKERTKILCQTARALEFLHINIPGVRKPIIHGDVKPRNILLDAFLNARLGDTGLAVEIPDGHSHVTASHTYVGTLAFRDPFSVEERKRRPYNDTFSFGAVSLMLLSGHQSTVYSGVKKDPLPPDKIPLFKKMYEDHKAPDDINEQILDHLGYVDHSIWQEGIGPGSPGLAIGSYIGPCLREPSQRPTMEIVANTLQDVCKRTGISLTYQTENQKCVQCMVYNPVTGRQAFGCLENCPGFCKFCHSMSFHNPLVCPNHGHAHPLIGHGNTYVILVAGYEQSWEKASIFRSDISSFLNVLKDPRVVGICESNISTVLSSSKADVEQALNDVQRRISRSKSSIPSSLILYYSGHGTTLNDQFYLKVGNKVENWLEASWLKEKLGSVRASHLLLILDCCYSGGFQILPPVTSSGHHYTLWSSSMATQKSQMSVEEGSRFTKYLVSGLRSGTQCFLETRGIETCNICKQFRDACKQMDILSVEKLQDFVSKHVYLESLLGQNVQQPYTNSIPDDSLDIPLAYAYDQPLAYTIWFMINSHIEQPLIIEDPSKDMVFNRDLLFRQCKVCFDHVAAGLNGAHMMIAHTDRKGKKLEIVDTSDMMRFLTVRGEILTVELRTMEAYLTTRQHIPSKSSDFIHDENGYLRLLPFVVLVGYKDSIQAMANLENDVVFQNIMNKVTEMTIQYPARREPKFSQPWEATPSSLLSTQDINHDTVNPDDVDQTWIFNMVSCTQDHVLRIASLYKNTNERCKIILEKLHTFFESMYNTQYREHFLVVHITRQYVELQDVFL